MPNKIDLSSGFIPKILPNLPAPVRRTLDATGVKIIPGQPFTGSNHESAIASVNADSPNTIEVEDPKRFASAAPQTIVHEGTHLWQNNLPPAIQAKIPPDNPGDPYNYGGTAGLAAKRAQGLRLWNLPHEQAAAVMQYYESQGGEKAPKAIIETYKPWADDMNDVPLSAIEPTQPGQQGINTAPRPPQAMPETYQATDTYAKGDPAPGDAPSAPVSHPAGKVTGFDEDTGLPIVKRSNSTNISNSSNSTDAAQKTAKEPALKPEIQVATNAPQPIGKTEPESGRKITQPSDNPATDQKLASDAIPEFRAVLEDAVKGVPGAKLAAIRSAKDPKRLAEKINGEDQPAETVSDYGAAQISVDSPKDRNAVVAAVKERFPVVKEDDNFAQGDKEYGYRNHTLQVQMPNGASMELQIVPREVLEANAAEHGDYKKAREADLHGNGAEAKKAAATAKAKNDAAMAAFNERNGSGKLVKGSQVTLADGTKATISYLDPSGRIARVRTADGKSQTVRQSQLRMDDDDVSRIPKGSTLVHQHIRKLPAKE